MKPLSPLTYHWRHKRNALLLLALVTLATTVLYVIVGVLDSLPAQLHYSYLTRLSRVRPDRGEALEPSVVSQIRLHPDVERVVPDNGLSISVPTLGGIDSQHLMGVPGDDVQYLMARCGVRLKQGRTIAPRRNEFMLSEEIARALELEVGDQIDRTVSNRYDSVLEPLVLVGTLEGTAGAEPSVRVGFVSYEYLEGHELYAPRRVSLLVLEKEGHKGTVDAFLETAIASTRTEVETYGQIVRLAAWARRFVYLTFGIVNCVVAIVVALVVGVINQIALTQRIAEFGLLHALGQHKRKLTHRLTLETTVLAGTGWIAGMLLAQLVLAWLKSGLYYAKGMELDLTNLTPVLFVLPIPLTVIVLAALSIRRVFARLDAVAIVERGKLSLEAQGRRRAVKRSTDKPLSSLTFYLRHRRRGVVLVASAALVIVGVALPTFLLSAVADAMASKFEYLRYVSRVRPSSGRAIDAGAMGQIKNHPTVERVIPVLSLGLQVDIPPGGVNRASLYGVPEGEMPALVELLGMHVAEGRLPHPRSNEVALSAPVALNRGLYVGDSIGTPVYERGEWEQLDVDDVPTEMVVVGILGTSERPGQTISSDSVWLGVASYEYLESHERTSSRPAQLLIAPAAGRKPELDAWLEENAASAQIDVSTYHTEYREHRQIVRGLIVVFAAIGCVTAIVAAIAMATLNHIFFAQRREEFGTLHAVGRSRRWLVLRTIKETGSMAAGAWLVGATLCGLGLLGLQSMLYAPKGLYLNLFSPAPWLFTLPIPLAVVAASAATIAWMLSRLDPVAVIERR
jgi:ABC-type lipoprotein release transport system permease subunit